jgi:hypothetical protein
MAQSKIAWWRTQSRPAKKSAHEYQKALRFAFARKIVWISTQICNIPYKITLSDVRIGCEEAYVCMYVCMHVWMYACMYVCMYECMHVCMYACMYVCMYACMYVCKGWARIRPTFALRRPRSIVRPNVTYVSVDRTLQMKRTSLTGRHCSHIKFPGRSECNIGIAFILNSVVCKRSSRARQNSLAL